MTTLIGGNLLVLVFLLWLTLQTTLAASPFIAFLCLMIVGAYWPARPSPRLGQLLAALAITTFSILVVLLFGANCLGSGTTPGGCLSIKFPLLAGSNILHAVAYAVLWVRANKTEKYSISLLMITATSLLAAATFVSHQAITDF